MGQIRQVNGRQVIKEFLQVQVLLVLEWLCDAFRGQFEHQELAHDCRFVEPGQPLLAFICA